MKRAAPAEINLIAISTSQIHMLAKEAERKALKSNAERNQSQKHRRINRRVGRLQKDALEKRKKLLSRLNRNKNKKQVNN
jgi:hypothetical protein